MTAQNSWPSTPFNSGYAFQIDGDTNPTPTQIRVLQSSSLSMKSTNKELFGQNIFPVAVGRAQIKVSGKIKFAESSPRLVRDFVGAANNSLMNAGQTLVANNESDMVPASSTYTITVSNAATFATDLGVLYQATGEPLTRVSSVAAAGQYSVNTTTGVYTFYSADASAAVFISYAYTLASVGDTITLSNTAAGAANAFQMMMGATFQGLQTNLQLYECVPDSLNLWDTKIGDFNMPELEFGAFVNAAGNLGNNQHARPRLMDVEAIKQARLQDSRALIFTNLLNGVPVWQVCRDFRKSESEVMNIFRFILRKIKSRRLERMEPPIVGNSIQEIKRQRLTVLTILPKLNLDKDPLYRDVLHESVDLKNDGTVRNVDVLRQMKPLPEHLRMPPLLKP